MSVNIVVEAAKNVVAELQPFETAMDIAIARSGRLIASLAEGRLEADLAPIDAHAAMLKALATASALGAARTEMVGLRKELVFARVRLGLEEDYIGGLAGCPTKSAVAAESAVPTQVVA